MTTVLNTAAPVHHTGTTDVPWDKGPQEKRLPSPMPVATAKKAYGWYDSGRANNGEIVKDACKFLHHMVSTDGVPGNANLGACRNGLARLSGSDVPESEQDAVRKHLQAHLDDAKGGSNSMHHIYKAYGDAGKLWNLQVPKDKRELRIENKAAAVADVYIYDEITWFGITAADFVNALKGVTAKSLNVHINSPGGDAFDGIAILNTLRNYNGEVTTIVEGLAASAASFIAMAGSKVQMSDNSMLMIHDAHGIALGNASDMRDLADRLDQMSDNIASIYAGKAGGTRDYWRNAMKEETWYTAEEAVQAKLADEVLLGSQPSNSLDLSVFRFMPQSQDPTTTPSVGQLDEDFDPESFRDLLRGVYQ